MCLDFGEHRPWWVELLPLLLQPAEVPLVSGDGIAGGGLQGQA
jgi:hypothetical protein